ncbi:unnamed protein product [Parnassius mnemosyne]|uniref:Uncharacterized protein n=1 Tax=Parnassius mnemosyne TaxID=213953 RepID=A0AAV1K6W4_9NEOP
MSTPIVILDYDRNDLRVESTRTSRRLSSNFDSSGPTSATKYEDVQPTFRPRSSRRREEPPPSTPRDINRTRPKTKISDTNASPTVTEQSPTENGRSEKFDSRRNNRLRSRPIETEANVVTSYASQDINVKSKSRQINRRPQYTATTAPLAMSSPDIEDNRIRDINNRKTQSSSTQTPLKISSPVIDDRKSKTIESNFEDFTRIIPKEEDVTSVQFKRRSTTAKTKQSVTSSTPKSIRSRGRINTRTNVKLEDMASSGATNDLTIAEKIPISETSSENTRSSRKLRYRTRLSETDTNLTGDGILSSNEVIKPVQKKRKINSQLESPTPSPTLSEKNVQRNSERSPSKSTTVTTMRVVRRPSARGKDNTVPSRMKPKVKTSDEIGDDDNYPESFKALIQTKNASTQVSSPSSESLSVKETHKVNIYTQPIPSFNTVGDLENTTRLRSKLNTTESELKNGTTDDSITTVNDSYNKTTKPQEYRVRGSYVPKSRKLSGLNVAFVTKSTSSSPATERSYKFNRKLKTSSTEEPVTENLVKNKRFQSRQHFQKTLVHSPNYSRKRFDKKDIISTDAITTNESVKTSINTSVVNNKIKLPRTNYYSRLRNNIKNDVTATTNTVRIVNETQIADKKIETTADMPLIFSLINKPVKNTIPNNVSEERKEEFLIAVSSKESRENNTDNEVVTNAEQSENKSEINEFSTTQKYHANYKDKSAVNDSERKDYIGTTPTPPSIRNIQTRKYTRKIVKSKERIINSSPFSATKERTLRKYSDIFSKTTEASTNGIINEPEKPKGRFSSKYRASYLDKPFYKPTVPTVTPTTVMGEEIQLGDMNAISFTQTRSTISSADLKLSESLVKPSHVMNVEASNHSPSVTVSIFDALAEILTSTPRIQISTTTEVPQQYFTDTVVKQTFNGVSNNNNVNSVTDLSSQGTSINTLIPVQITDQTTPNVLNRLTVGERISPSLKEEEKFTPTSTSQSTSYPTPTTPISARKPFAIKILYSDTERLTDEFMTSSELTTNQPTTHSAKMVYNTASDLLLSNKKLVSSELTSMLSNNIIDIIQNLDDESRSKLTVDMAKLLKTIIPRAMNKLSTLSNTDVVPNTTPYSLEDIKDTENININENQNSSIEINNLFQNVLNGNVNRTGDTVDLLDLGINSQQAVNSSVYSQLFLSNNLSEFESKTTVADIETTTEYVNTNTPPSFDLPATTLKTSSTTLDINIDTGTLSGLTKSTSVNNVETSTANNPMIDSTIQPFSVPFFGNSITDKLPSNEINNTPPLIALSDRQFNETDNINIKDPSQISNLQLWVLSKKARVLNMIEQIIKEHNDEIANASFTALKEQTNSPFSDRLAEIINTMDSKNESTVLDIDLTTPNFISGPVSNALISTTQFELPDKTTTETIINSVKTDITVPSMTTSTDVLPTNIPITEVYSTTISADVSEIIASQASSEIADALHSTTMDAELTTVEETTESQDTLKSTIQSTENPTTIAQVNTEVTTSLIDLEWPTKTSLTESNLETTTQAGIETTTVTLVKETKSNDLITTKAQLNVVTQPTIPKKDYVIFGILPNNTVVRKDPNDNVLERLTEATPYIIYGVLPNNTIIRKFPNGTRVPRLMQKIDVLPISPWSLRNPYSPIHNNPAIVRPQPNPIRVSTNTVTSTNTNNGMENRLTTDTVNNQQMMISSSAPNLKGTSSLGITTATIKPFADKSTASHVLSLRTTTMLPSIHEILLNSLSSATKEEMVISSMTSSTREPRILTLDIDPETQQIRTEKPGDGKGNAVFKFIPIDEVTVPPQNTNVLKLASTKSPIKYNTEKDIKTVTPIPVTEINSSILQIQKSIENMDESTTTKELFLGTSNEIISNDGMGSQSSTPVIFTNSVTPNEFQEESTQSPKSSLFDIKEDFDKIMTTVKDVITVQPPTTKLDTPQPLPIMSTTTVPLFTFNDLPRNDVTNPITTDPANIFSINLERTTQNVVNANVVSISSTQSSDGKLTTLDSTILPATNTIKIDTNKKQENSELLQSLQAVLSTTLKPELLTATGQKLPVSYKPGGTMQTTTLRSIEDDIRQFEEDTKLLKALLQATGRNPNELKIPNLGDIRAIPAFMVKTNPITTTTTTTTTRTTTMTTTPKQTKTTTSSIDEEIKKLKEDTQLLQALLQITGQNTNLNQPVISKITSNVRIASNPLTTSIESNPTTSNNMRPVYTTVQPNKLQTEFPQTISTLTTLQDQQSTVTEEIGISTTYPPIDRRLLTTTNFPEPLSTINARRAPETTRVTTEIPSTSTFSAEEDLEFLNNLKSVLNTNNVNNDDPEAALANRVIALAVERSLSELQTGKQTDSSRGSKNINSNSVNSLRTTTVRTTSTTTKPTTTTFKPRTMPSKSTPSLEDDIKQFERDTKLLQALLKATGQDPSKFNIPTLPSVNVSPKVSPIVKEDLTFVPLTNKPSIVTTNPTTTKTFGAKIAVKDNIKDVQDEAKLLQTLIKLKDAQETTTHKNKLAITGQSSDEALKKLIQKAKPTVMVSEATKSSVSLSTEYGNSNDALLAALLKEQGFGPTTASSLDEQVRLAALLNQVVVTPKARRTTTLPPPPPALRRPILDGLAWIWQQWRETEPGSGNVGTRTNKKRPASTSSSVASSSVPAPSRTNWFGSGPFVGNADETPSSNRIPLEPPRAVAAEQAPGRGQLVSAAINVTRAFSQFLGAAIQGAANTVQSVIRAGQRAATDVYSNGSG